MKNRTAIYLLGAFVLVLVFGIHSPAGSQPIETGQKAEWKLDSSFGFEVWIAANIVIDAPALSHRHIYFFIDAPNFTEQNIRKIFSSLAAEYKNPYELMKVGQRLWIET